jgi:hypothetical protein
MYQMNESVADQAAQQEEVLVLSSIFTDEEFFYNAGSYTVLNPLATAHNITQTHFQHTTHAITSQKLQNIIQCNLAVY